MKYLTDSNIKLLTSGNKEEWDRFVDSFSPVIYSAVLKLFLVHTGKIDEWDVKEVVQEVFLRLVREDYHLLKSYDPSRASLVTYLTIVTRSTTIDFLRRLKPQSESLDEKIHDIAAPQAPSTSNLNIPAHLLSGRQKLILRLLFDEEMEPSQVAELLGIDVQTVRSCKHKALIKLRKFFQATL